MSNRVMSRRLILFVGTEKGLFRLDGDDYRDQWSLSGPYIAGYSILHICWDPRHPQCGYAASTHKIWGSHIYTTEDAGMSWNSLKADPGLISCDPTREPRAIWCVTPGHASEPETLYAGIDPPGLFISRDRGRSWHGVDGLNRHVSRPSWEPSRGGFAVHSIYIDPTQSSRLYAAISAGGVFRSEDSGVSWKPINQNVRAENHPQRYPITGHNVHRLIMHPTMTNRLYRQCYNGTYRSDDHGESWTEITEGLPSDFGYALAVDPKDPDTVFVIPESSSHLRIAADAKLRVYRSEDAGRHWQALTNGLPQKHVYVTVLREAMVADPLTPCGVYFGTSSGHVFASSDRGTQWKAIAGFLPRILSLAVVILPNLSRAST